jgi:hypothetical protein
MLNIQKELMKKNQMLDFDEIEHFYDVNYFTNNKTRTAWYIFCFKFLTCVNGEWLKSLNAVNARNQVNMYRFVTVSDEAFVRWVLEVKKPKLQREEKLGWPDSNKRRKPNGIHDSRQYSHRYAVIHQEVKEHRNGKIVQDWNNLFWSMYRYIHPKLFADPSSVVCDLNQGMNKTLHPDEDEYDPDNEKNVETKVFNFSDEENPDAMKQVLTNIV